MAAQHGGTSTAVTRRSGSMWPRDMADLVNAWWGDLEWPRQVFAGFDGSLRIEETMTDDSVIVRAEIPGVDPDKDVEISVEDGLLTISAKRESKTEETKDGGGFRSEFRYGRFVRQIRVPRNADLDALSASYADGVIEIKVPIKPEEATKARKIEIKRG